VGTNVSTTYITCPADPKLTLGIKLPFLVMIVKNMKKYFTFEVMVLDDKNVRRRFRASNYQSTTRVKPFICTMPMRLDDGWNQIQFNLSDFTKRAYGSNYMETLRVQIHANCRVRRVYFSDRLYAEDELPAEFKLYLPIQTKPRTAQHWNHIRVVFYIRSRVQIFYHNNDSEIRLDWNVINAIIFYYYGTNTDYFVSNCSFIAIG